MNPDILLSGIWNNIMERLEKEPEEKNIVLPSIVMKFISGQVSNPIALTGLIVTFLLFFIYCANNFMCMLLFVIVGITYVDKHNDVDGSERRSNNTNDVFYKYVSLNLIITLVFELMYMIPLIYHLKFALMLLLGYSLNNNNEWIDMAYYRVSIFRKILLNIIIESINKTKKEFKLD